ncbi:MBL fold metallo-hydrolase [Leptospira selangorensis]|uniref:MBL fold metallo-hydrolase n=1 Tax=Leptospira selangorensis TaxID=2484982 RepID=A0A5F2BXI1_9LEPT|nr:MBL fold metallo-hydrolase [Leptospira selangorensis]TGM12235.1 MBL fold metallo-hydrolase [Leptospira selangorensis]TGM14722.1 MBL fold metallo-hydrolase [Leptospira selangorensis]
MKIQRIIFSVISIGILTACAVTSNRSVLVNKGTPANIQDISPSDKGPIIVKKIIAADWLAEREGLINLKDLKAVAAGLQSGKESIQIYFYVMDHPKFGRYVIDTGLADIFRKDKKEWPVSGIVASQMNLGELKIHTTIKEWLQKEPKKVEGIFLTHLHLDHILGTQDFPAGTSMYTGQNEPGDSRFLHLFVQGSTDTLLGHDTSLSELNFLGREGSPIRFLDFFGDQSLYIISVPGHTEGSIAFLIKSTNGVQLVTGDTCHTSWGWLNNVTPGGFTKDLERNKVSLDLLQAVAAKFPKIQIHPGHQSIPTPSK